MWPFPNGGSTLVLSLELSSRRATLLPDDCRRSQTACRQRDVDWGAHFNPSASVSIGSGRRLVGDGGQPNAPGNDSRIADMGARISLRVSGIREPSDFRNGGADRV